MDFVFLLVSFIGIFYVALVKLVQKKFGKQQEMKELQKKLKALNEELNEARKRNDRTKMDEVTSRQLSLLGEMNKLMLVQFKPLAIIIVIFLLFSYAADLIDQNEADDVVIEGNSVITYVSEDGFEDWVVEIKSKDFGRKFVVMDGEIREIGRTGGDAAYSLVVQENLLTVAYEGEFSLILDNGTSFYADLPFTIPVINVKRIIGVQYWFIFVAFTIGLLHSIVVFVYTKLKKG